MATLYSTPGFDKFHAFVAQAEIDVNDNNPIICQPCESVLDDDDPKLYSKESIVDENIKYKHDSPFNIDHQDEITSRIQIQQRTENRQLELLYLHHKYGHLPFKRLKKMAKDNVIPGYHTNTPTPACVACLYGRATRKQWRHKTPSNKCAHSTPTKPGQLLSVDMMYSPTPGLVTQMTGILTKQRYKYATIYIDHYSNFCYLHLQKTAGVDETLKGKLAFELYARQHGVHIKGYHADNGVFRANRWVLDCQLKQQVLTFAAVNAHHQNGKAEPHICTLQELTRTQLIHLSHKW